MELLCDVIEKSSRECRDTPLTFDDHDSVEQICSLATCKSISDQALAFVTLFGGVIWKVGQTYCVYQNGRRFNSWLIPERAAIAFCLHQGISFDTSGVSDAVDSN